MDFNEWYETLTRAERGAWLQSKPSTMGWWEFFEHVYTDEIRRVDGKDESWDDIKNYENYRINQMEMNW